VKVWSAASRECTDTKMGHVGPVRVCAISPDGFQIASCGTNIKLWNTHFSECLGTLKDHVGGVLAVAFNPEGTLIASGGDDKDVRVWEAMVGDEPPPETPMKRLKAHQTPVHAVCFSPDGVGLASCAASGNLRLWVWARDECLFNLSSAHATAVHHLAFSADGLRIATAADSGSIKVWLSNGFEQLAELVPAHSDKTLALGFASVMHAVDVNKVAVSQGQRQPVITADLVEVLASTSEDGSFRLWDVSACMEKFRLEQMIKKHQATVAKQREKHAGMREQRRLQKQKEIEERKLRLLEEMAIQDQHKKQQEHRELLAAYQENGPALAADTPTMTPRGKPPAEEATIKDSCKVS